MASPSPSARAAAAWRPVPDWVRALAEACERESQAKVARRIGYSPSVVTQVLGATYRGDLAAVEHAVRGAFLGSTVSCPVLGEIDTVECRKHQRRPYAATANHLQVRLFKACRTCPNRRSG